MKRMLVATMVLGLAAAMAQGYVTTTVVKTGTASITTTTGTYAITIYKVTQTAIDGNNPTDPNRLMGVIAVGVGNMNDDPNDPNALLPHHGDDPFQAWRYYDENDYGKTATLEDATTKLTDATIRGADTHFLVPNIGTYSPATVSPDSKNDLVKGLYQWGTPAKYAICGDGVIYIQTGIPVNPTDLRTHSVDVLSVGVEDDASDVWGWTASTDQTGEKTIYEFKIPEPATLSLLALGALALIRRRRS